MKYNIFTVLNEGYERFGILFLSSIIDRLDLEKIENIFVYDTGLSEQTKKKFSIFQKVKIINSGIATNSDTKVHGKTWQENVYSKAKLLRECVIKQEEFLPTIMVDADSIFVNEFYNLIDFEKDLVLCRRSSRGRAKNHISNSSHIGSFFAINKKTKKSLTFLENWIAKIEKSIHEDLNSTGQYVAKESPALSDTYEEMKGELKIQELSEPIISNIEVFPPRDAVIYHLKSDAGLMTVEERTSQAKARYYTLRYLA